MRHRAVASRSRSPSSRSPSRRPGVRRPAAGHLQRDLRLRARQLDREPARRQQLVVQAVGRPSGPGDPGPRHVRRHVRQLAGPLAAAVRQRLLRVRAQLRLLQRQRRARHLRDRRHRASAQQLSSFVNRVLAATGASKVDLVGHSQGGMMPRYYIKFLGGAAKVHTLVGLAPSNHGTTLNGLFTLASYFPGSNAVLADCPACQEQEAGSSFITNLNAGGETAPGVELHGDRVGERRGGHAVHLGVPAPDRTSPTSCCRASARSTRASTCRCPTTTSPTPTC